MNTNTALSTSASKLDEVLSRPAQAPANAQGRVAGDGWMYVADRTGTCMVCGGLAATYDSFIGRFVHTEACRSKAYERICEQYAPIEY